MAHDNEIDSITYYWSLNNFNDIEEHLIYTLEYSQNDLSECICGWIKSHSIFEMWNQNLWPLAARFALSGIWKGNV